MPHWGWEGQQLVINSNLNVRGQRSRSTATQVNPIGKGTQGVPCCFRLPPPRFSPWGRNTNLGRETWLDAPCAWVNLPRRRPSGERDARSLWAGPTWAAVRRAGLNPMRPNPGPGTGPSSFLGRKHWQKPDHVIQYPAPGRPWQGHRRSDGKVLPFVDPKPKRTSGARAVHLLASVRWAGIPSLGMGLLVKHRLALQRVRVPAGTPQGKPANASACLETKRR